MTQTTVGITSAESQMLACVATGYGDADRVISYRTDFPTPVITRPDQVLIRVKNAVVNPVDCKLRSGFMKAITRFKFPKVLGIDCAGEVVATGPAVNRLKVGDQVLGFAADGCYAQYAINIECRFWRKPDGISFEFASILPSTGVTVLQTFQSVLDLPEKIQRGTVLIQGGSGGTGSLAVMLAKHYFQAPFVFATCSRRNIDYVSKLGADRVIDYNSEDFEQVIRQEYGKPLQFILDCAGGSYETWRKAKRLLGPHGVFASIAYPFDEQKMTTWDFIGLVLSIGINKAEHLFGGPHFFWHLGEAREDEIEILASFFSQQPVLRDMIQIYHFPLTKLTEAYQHVERHQGGKVVIDI